MSGTGLGSVVLRFRYAMSGTDLRRLRYALSGTDLGYLLAARCLATILPLCNAMSGTDLGRYRSGFSERSGWSLWKSMPTDSQSASMSQRLRPWTLDPRP
eukprot:442219-Rhodomonas_salina.1